MAASATHPSCTLTGLVPCCYVVQIERNEAVRMRDALADTVFVETQLVVDLLGARVADKRQHSEWVLRLHACFA